jgi:hypothetical protein
MKKSSMWASLAGIVVLALPFSIFAQDVEDAPPPLSDVWVMVVKPGMQAEFNEAAIKHLNFRKDAGEARSWQAFRVVVGEDMTPIEFRSCCFDWADLDAFAATDQEKGLTADFNANVAPYLDHLHHYFEASDWENSHWPETGTGGPFYGVRTWTNKQGAGGAPNAAMVELSQLAKTKGWATDEKNWLWLSRLGGEEKISLVSSFESYADMAPTEQSFFEYAAEKLGEEAAGKMFNAFGSGFEDSEYTIWKLDESLSTPADDE